MALHHKWDVKNDFGYVLHFFSLTMLVIKIFNNLPNNIRETQDRNIFKTLVKKWIWDEVPSY